MLYRYCASIGTHKHTQIHIIYALTQVSKVQVISLSERSTIKLVFDYIITEKEFF